VLKLLEPLPRVGPLKPPLTEVMVVKEPFVLAVIYVDFCLGGHDMVVGLVVSLDVGKQPPVIEVGDCLAKCMVG